jgi:hypothetical protein
VGPIDDKGNWLTYFDQLGKKVKNKTKSQIVRKSLEPQWNFSFEFQLEANFRGLKIQVWDWDKYSSPDFMGEVIITYIPSGQEVDTWLKLAQRPSKPKEIVSGDLQVKYCYTPRLSLQKRRRTLGEMPAFIPSPRTLTESRDAELLQEIDSRNIIKIIFALKNASTMPFVLGKALKAICKWAAQLPHLEELNQLIDDKVLEDVVMALIKYPNVVDIAYYSVCCLASLSRMPRAKFNYTSGVAKAILDTLRAPPALTAQVNLTNHYCNCIITISNFCAANINDKSKILACQNLTEDSGLLIEVINLMLKYHSDSLLQTNALYMLANCSYDNESVKDYFLQMNLHKELLKLYEKETQLHLKWLPLHVLQVWLTSSRADHAQALLREASITKLVGIYSHANSMTPGPHRANYHAACVYLMSAILPHIEESLKAEMVADKKFVELLIDSYRSYKEEIPSIEHRPVLPQRIFSLLTHLTPLKAARTLIYKSMGGIQEIAEQSGAYLIVMNQAHKFVKAMEDHLTAEDSDAARDQLNTLKSSIEKTMIHLNDNDESSSEAVRTATHSRRGSTASARSNRAASVRSESGSEPGSLELDSKDIDKLKNMEISATSHHPSIVITSK